VPPASGRQVPLRRHQNVDDLAVLVDRPVQVDPSSRDLDIRLIREPSIPGSVSAGSCRVDQQQGEPLHPSINRDVINGDTTFGQQLLDVAIGQPVPQIPPNRNHDHVRRKPEPPEAGLR